MIFLFFIIGLKAQDTLIYNFEASLNTISPNWLGQTQFTMCNTTRIFGGYNTLNKQAVLSNFQVDLIPHYSMRVEIQFSKFGNWLNDKMCVFIYDYSSYCKEYSFSNTILQSNSMQYEEDLLTFDLDHNWRSAKIYIRPSSSASDVIYWGIRQFKLYVKQCQPQCDFCRFQYDNCQWKLAITSLTKYQDCNLDGWMVQGNSQYDFVNGGLCFLYFRGTIYQTFQLEYHERIKIRLKFYYGYYPKFQIDNNWIKFQNIQDSGHCEIELLLIHSSPKITITMCTNYDLYIRDFEIQAKFVWNVKKDGISML